MHILKELDTGRGRLKHITLITVASLLVIVAPVSAQATQAAGSGGLNAQEITDFILKLIQGATPIVVAILVAWQALSANKLRSQEVKLTEAESTIERQGKQIADAAEQQGKNTKRIEVLNSELGVSQTALQAALAEDARHLEALTKEIAVREQAERERDTAQATTVARDETIAQMKRQWEELQASIQEAERQRKEFQSIIQQLKDANSLEVNRITGERNDERTKRAAVEAENAELTLQNTNLGEQVRSIQEQLVDAQRRIDELERRSPPPAPLPPPDPAPSNANGTPEPTQAAEGTGTP